MGEVLLQGCWTLSRAHKGKGVLHYQTANICLVLAPKQLLVLFP